MTGETSDDPRAAYRAAYEGWQAQLERLHAVLLDGVQPRPDQLKGLLNREASTKEHYDQARRRLLGIEE
jgi:hypothetical protein